MIEYIVKNWEIVVTLLFLLTSEAMDWMPSLKASSLSKAVFNFLKGEAQKAKPAVDKLLESEKA